MPLVGRVLNLLLPDYLSKIAVTDVFSESCIILQILVQIKGNCQETDKSLIVRQVEVMVCSGLFELSSCKSRYAYGRKCGAIDLLQLKMKVVQNRYTER